MTALLAERFDRLLANQAASSRAVLT